MVFDGIFIERQLIYFESLNNRLIKRIFYRANGNGRGKETGFRREWNVKMFYAQFMAVAKLNVYCCCFCSHCWFPKELVLWKTNLENIAANRSHPSRFSGVSRVLKIPRNCKKLRQIYLDTCSIWSGQKWQNAREWDRHRWKRTNRWNCNSNAI